jgi:FtsP/CotA-like multicopper oxidase with cupredoxin domain
MGLAGLYLIEDDEERALGVPGGAHDVPLLIQDRLFAPDGSLLYKTVNHLAARGGTLLVNGAPWPRLDVATRKYRFRIVNGSNATPLRLRLSSGVPLIQVATDGGLLPSPVSCEQIPLAMAERVEIIIDLSRYPVGTRLVLQNLNTEGVAGAIASEVMQVKVSRAERDDRALPSRLADVPALDRSTQYAPGAVCSRREHRSGSCRSRIGESTVRRSTLATPSPRRHTATSRSGALPTRSSWAFSAWSILSISTWSPSWC